MKNFCYSPSCNFVKTGFHLEQYWVCKFCKMEITDTLQKRKEEERKQEKEREEAKKKNTDDGDSDPWTFL